MENYQIERELVRRPKLASYGLKSNNDVAYYSIWKISKAGDSDVVKAFLSREEAEAWIAEGGDKKDQE